MIFAAGCKKKPSSTTELRATTHDLVAAAQKAGGRNTEIMIRPEMEKLRGGQTRLAADEIIIGLADASAMPTVEGALDRVAASHNLTRAPAATSPGGVHFIYLLNGKPTQTIRIIVPIPGKAATAKESNANGPQLAIIIDDLGNDPAPAETLLNLPFPITLSILPGEAFSTEIDWEAHQRGDEVLLHLPMESESDAVKSEAVELRVGMSANEVDQIVARMLATVPHAVGVNNHEGSRATADPQLMAELMPALRERRLFFIDSRTTAATVAFAAAEQVGVRAASRKVFLDDVETREAILQQLDLAARDAAKLGAVIAIGHPHPTTLAALEEGLPKLRASGVRLVYTSALVQ